MKKTHTIFLLFFAVSTLISAQNKQKIYTLQGDAQLLSLESGLGLALGKESYVLTIQQADGCYAITPQKTYGPFEDCEVKAFPYTRSKENQFQSFSFSQGEHATVIMSDGKVYADLAAQPEVVYNNAGTNWAIVSYEKAKSKQDEIVTKVYFKNGEILHFEGYNQMILSNQLDKYARVAIQKTEENAVYYLNNGEKYTTHDGCEAFFSEDGSHFIIINKRNQQIILDNAQTYPTPKNYLYLVFSPDGQDWAFWISEGNEQELVFKSGKRSEKGRIHTPSFDYDTQYRQWVWLIANPQLSFCYEDGTTLPLPHKSQVVENKDFTTFLTTSPKNPNTIFSVQTSSTKQSEVYIRTDKKTIKKLPYSNCPYPNATPFGDFYAISDQYDAEQNLISSTFQPLGESPYKAYTFYFSPTMHFPTSSTWYAVNSDDGTIVFSDGTTVKNTFSLYFHTESKTLYWLSLEGKDIFKNSKIMK